MSCLAKYRGVGRPYVLFQAFLKFSLKTAVCPKFRIDLFQFHDGGHEGFGNVLPSIFAEPALFNGNACHGILLPFQRNSLLVVFVTRALCTFGSTPPAFPLRKCAPLQRGGKEGPSFLLPLLCKEGVAEAEMFPERRTLDRNIAAYFRVRQV